MNGITLIGFVVFSIMNEIDAFGLNILGVQDLVENPTNKIFSGIDMQEGIEDDLIDELELEMSDEELLKLRTAYEQKSAPYTGKIEPRQKANKTYLFGTQQGAANGKTVPSNLLFQSTATFVPQALSKNPEPVVWSDNSEEGKLASNDIKTMLQFHADITCLRKKLGVMVWHWSIYFIGVVKHGWNTELNDISTELRKPSNFILDPDGYIDEYGDYQGEYLGEKIKSTAQELVDLFPESKDYITLKVNGKMGTVVIRTEWWNNKYCFTTFEEEVLDKSKNPFFNYGEGRNHFANPKMPYTWLSVFSLQEQPHDFTNLIEQNISNQDRINERDYQISKNLAHGNNAIAASDTAFDVETAKQAMNALEQGDIVLVPGGNIDAVLKRIPANSLPAGILEAQNNDKQTLLSVYGTQGITASQPNEDQTARGMILNQSFDSTRIGGGVGDALEQVADNIFNWWLQLYYVFYDEKHYAAIMGAGRAVEYVGLVMTNEERQFVVSVSPNSMKPKDEISQQNLAMERWKGGAIDPIGLMKELDSADPMEDAKRLVIWTSNPQLYLQTYFPESMPAMDSPDPGNPLDTNTEIQPMDESLSAPQASPALDQVSLDQGVAMPQ